MKVKVNGSLKLFLRLQNKTDSGKNSLLLRIKSSQKTPYKNNKKQQHKIKIKM